MNNHENCEFWASIGECEKNPNYMLKQCQLSCHNLRSANDKKKAEEASKLAPSELHSIVETDIYGNPLKFEQFKGKVLYIVNVASYCGYAPENYEHFRHLAKYRSRGLEIIIAPCNQFGFQEPGDSVAISTFVKKQKFEGTVLAKGDVNGPKTRPLYEYLKKVTGRDLIHW